MTFDALTTRGFASPYDPAAQQLSQAVFGQASWPTFTSEPGASAWCMPALAIVTNDIGEESTELTSQPVITLICCAGYGAFDITIYSLQVLQSCAVASATCLHIT